MPGEAAHPGNSDSNANRPTVALSQPPAVPQAPATPQGPAAMAATVPLQPAGPGEAPRPIRPVSLRSDGGGHGLTPPSTPPVPQPPPQPVTPPAADPARPVLPTPRDLAARISPDARTGVPEERARLALSKDPQARQLLMNQMRQLHAALGASNDVPRLAAMTDVVLLQLARVAVDSELLVRAYGLGYQGRALLTENLDDAKEKLRFWLSRFAKLF